MKNILLLGATGSIGDSVLSVIKQNQSKYNLYGISFNQNIKKAIKILGNFNPKYIHTGDNEIYKANKAELDKKIIFGENALNELISHEEIDIVICAITGFAGLHATHQAVKTGKKILLANKESIVVAGDIIIPISKKYGSEIIPIDSEHNAIYQCLGSMNPKNDVKKIIITASGGPFLNKSIEDLKHVSIDQALNHPNWKMGSKISIDSASLVNKCLELIEAKYLFGLPEDFFDLVIHPQSIVHSIVSYRDGSSICHMSQPNMTVPIAHALSSNERLEIDFSEINFNDLNLSFNQFPKDRRKLELLAREVCKNGSTYGTIFNAANEIAVEKFLNKEIRFDQIYDIIFRTFDKMNVSNETNLNAIYDIDNQTRIEANKVVKSIKIN